MRIRQSIYLISLLVITLISYQNCSDVSLQKPIGATKICDDSHNPVNVSYRYISDTNEFEFYAIEEIGGRYTEAINATFNWRIDENNDGVFEEEIINQSTFRKASNYFNACQSYKIVGEYKRCDATIEFPSTESFNFIRPDPITQTPSRVEKTSATNVASFYVTDSESQTITNINFDWYINGVKSATSGSTATFNLNTFASCQNVRIEAKYPVCSTFTNVPFAYQGILNPTNCPAPSPTPEPFVPPTFGPPTNGTPPWNATNPDAVFGLTSLAFAFPGGYINSSYGFYSIGSGDVLSFPFNSNDIAQVNPNGGFLQLFGNPSGPMCACYTSMTKYPGDFRSELGSCRAWQYGEVPGGSSLMYIAGTQQYSGLCTLRPNENYYLNIYCGVTNPELYSSIIGPIGYGGDPSQVAMNSGTCDIQMYFRRLSP